MPSGVGTLAGTSGDHHSPPLPEGVATSGILKEGEARRNPPNRVAPGSPPGEITALYTCGNPSVLVCRGSSVVRIEDLYTEEDRRRRPHTGVGELFQRSDVAGAPLLQMIHGGPNAEGRHIIRSEDRTVEEPLRDNPRHGKVPKTRVFGRFFQEVHASILKTQNCERGSMPEKRGVMRNPP
ncbi:hypothetical protein QJS10_CPA01g01677 [Acorus calamus]|uniref:Uncharacterized protein n=1 Tax=Acorus calamus TaxID=4465 RepID=A0AAV9FI56_ACOCL|nr:hypothetical protein QJS10_CPA01g01677 [Acorus calamus]